MSELATTPKPDSVLAKTSRRVAIALTMSIGVGLLMMYSWSSSPSGLFLRITTLGLSATAAFAVLEAWPRRPPRRLQRWALQVVTVGAVMPVTTLLMYVLHAAQLHELSEQLVQLRSDRAKREAPRWIRAQARKTLRMIAIDDIDYVPSDAKYTIVAWRDGGKPAEAVRRTPLNFSSTSMRINSRKSIDRSS